MNAVQACAVGDTGQMVWWAAPVVDEAHTNELLDRVYRLHSQAVRVEGGPAPELGIYGSYRYEIIAGLRCDDVAGADVHEWDYLYQRIVGFAASCFDQIAAAPERWRRSSLVAKTHLPGDYHGIHRDSNPVTAVLHLTSGEPTRLHSSGRVDEVPAVPGTLVLFPGRTVRHAVFQQRQGRRVVLVANVYQEGDMHRPEGLDEVIYAL